MFSKELESSISGLFEEAFKGTNSIYNCRAFITYGFR